MASDINSHTEWTVSHSNQKGKGKMGVEGQKLKVERGGMGNCESRAGDGNQWGLQECPTLRGAEGGRPRELIGWCEKHRVNHGFADPQLRLVERAVKAGKGQWDLAYLYEVLKEGAE